MIQEKVNRIGKDLLGMLIEQFKGGLSTWDVQCAYHMAKEGLFAVEPIRSLTKNVGFRADAVHTGFSDPVMLARRYYNFDPSWVAGVEANHYILCQLAGLYEVKKPSVRWFKRAFFRRLCRMALWIDGIVGLNYFDRAH